MADKWRTLGSLIGIATVCQGVRFCISYIAAGSDMLSSTNTSKEEYGLLAGPGFLLVYAILTLPLGRLVDKLSRLKWFIIFNSVGVALSTGLNALAFQFWGLLYPRCMLAFFSAGLEPASVKLISLNFPPEMRGTAVGIYMSAVYVGSSLASATLILSVFIGWRLTFLVLALVGISSSLVGSFLIKNLVVSRERRLQVSDEKSDWTLLLRNKTIIFTIIGTFFRYSAGFARGYYEALYFSSVFPNEIAVYSVINSLALLLTPINLALAGRFTDKKEAENKMKYRPMISSISNLVSVPLLIAMYLTTNFYLAMTCLVLVYAIGETYISISVTMMVNVTPANLRGLQTSLLMGVSFIGGCLSTVCLGFLSSDYLQVGLISFVVSGYLIAGLLFGYTIYCYPSDLRDHQEEQKKLIPLE